jgi:hypothetical protein
VLRAESAVRVLTDDTVVVHADPSEALGARMSEACGAYLSAMEASLDSVDGWWWRMHYGYATRDTCLRHLPPT